MNELGRNVILDIGNGFSKIGFSGDEEPICVFPTVIAYPNYPTVNQCGRPYASPQQMGFGIGTEGRYEKLHVHHIIERGEIKNWSNLEQTLNYTFQDNMMINPSQHRFLITEQPLNKKIDREKITHLLFETFDIEALYIACQSVLSLYAAGKSTGVVIESGYDLTHVVPIYQGYILSHAINRLEIGGNDIDKYLIKILNERGYTFETKRVSKGTDFNGKIWVTPTLDLPFILEDIKKKYCNIPLILESVLKERCENKVNYDIEYLIPKNGKVITGEIIYEEFNYPSISKTPTSTTMVLPGNELLNCTEILFNPSIIQDDSSKGIHELLYDSIIKCDLSIRNEMYKNILICGGNTMIKGFDDRLKSQFKEMVPSGIEINFLTSLPFNKRNLSSWIGGSLLSSNNDFNLWITKEDYNEIGPSLSHTLFIEHNNNI